MAALVRHTLREPVVRVNPPTTLLPSPDRFFLLLSLRQQRLRLAHRYATRFCWVYLAESAVFASITTVGARAFASLCGAPLSGSWANAIDPEAWPLFWGALFLLSSTAVCSLILQNRAMVHFGNSEVVPVYFCFFSVGSGLGSAMVYQVMNTLALWSAQLCVLRRSGSITAHIERCMNVAQLAEWRSPLAMPMTWLHCIQVMLVYRGVVSRHMWPISSLRLCRGHSAGTLLAMDASHVARPPLLCQWRLLHIFHARSSHLSMESEARCGHHCRASVVDCRCGGAIVGPCYTSATHASASINHFLTSLHVDRRHAVCLCHSPFHLFGDGGHPCHWWYRFL